MYIDIRKKKLTKIESHLKNINLFLHLIRDIHFLLSA